MDAFTNAEQLSQTGQQNGVPLAVRFYNEQSGQPKNKPITTNKLSKVCFQELFYANACWAKRAEMGQKFMFSFLCTIMSVVKGFVEKLFFDKEFDLQTLIQ